MAARTVMPRVGRAQCELFVMGINIAGNPPSLQLGNTLAGSIRDNGCKFTHPSVYLGFWTVGGRWGEQPNPPKPFLAWYTTDCFPWHTKWTGPSQNWTPAVTPSSRTLFCNHQLTRPHQS